MGSTIFVTAHRPDRRQCLRTADRSAATTRPRAFRNPRGHYFGAGSCRIDNGASVMRLFASLAAKGARGGYPALLHCWAEPVRTFEDLAMRQHGGPYVFSDAGKETCFRRVVPSVAANLHNPCHDLDFEDSPRSSRIRPCGTLIPSTQARTFLEAHTRAGRRWTC